MPLQIYIGPTPGSSAERLALRALALDLRGRAQAARADTAVALLHFTAGGAPVDLLLLRPHAAIVGLVRSYRAPVAALPGARWAYRDTGEPIVEAGGASPIQHVAAQRDAVAERLHQAAPDLLGTPPEALPFERMIGALICAPIAHPDSQISLAIAEHRRQLKVLGLDELLPLADMARLSVQLAPEAMHAIAAGVFGGRLWHDGARFLFELAPPRFQLRVLPGGARPERVLPLMEGENIVGRRRAPQGNEYRIALSGDELISADHAVLACGDDDQVQVRDTSKNGTWLTLPGSHEERIRRARALAPGTELRMGITRLRLERFGEPAGAEAEA